MKKEMLINVLQPEECRIAIVEDGVLEELYVERNSHESYTGNIYKGKIVNLEPAIQAAFVDFSVGRNGFLHVSDVEPQYFHRHLTADEDPEVRPRPRPPERERDRGRKPPQPPPPRRERGRGRDDRRPGLPPEPNDLPPPYPTPPGRIEERPAIAIETPHATVWNRPAIETASRPAIEAGIANVRTSRFEAAAIAPSHPAASAKVWPI